MRSGGILPSGAFAKTDAGYVREWRRFNKALCAGIESVGSGRCVVVGWDPGVLLRGPNGEGRHLDQWAAVVIARHAGWRPRKERAK